MAVCKDIWYSARQLAGNRYPTGNQCPGRRLSLHHTKVKADLGVAKTIADLVGKGHMPCVPLSEHQPYDLVVVLMDGRIVKIQVKYASLRKNGSIQLGFRTSWADRHGTHMKRYNQNDFDYYALFCPEKDCVLYVPNTADCPKVIRFERPLNRQTKYVKWASDYLGLGNGSPQRLYATRLKR